MNNNGSVFSFNKNQLQVDFKKGINQNGIFRYDLWHACAVK